MSQHLLLADPPATVIGGKSTAPVAEATAAPMLRADWVPENTHEIDFQQLPRLPSQHVVVSDVRSRDGVNQHNYLVHHRGIFWIMWSDGPGVEDRVGQRVKFATSHDALTWSEGEFLTPVPPRSGVDSPYYGTRSDLGLRWIARGFWQRGGELIALASLDEAAGFFGPSLALHAFQLQPDEETWQSLGVIADDTINNFPPKPLSDGRWMMSRRGHDYKQQGVHFLIGGQQQIDHWDSVDVLGSVGDLAAEEPFWWELPNGDLLALFRDNRRGGYLYRSFSSDDGRTWSKPAQTNFPDATSKMHGLRIGDGRYVFVSNANPRGRDPLVLSLSEDGIVFTKMAYLVGGRRVDYPHVIEHDHQLLVAFSGGKQTVEVLKIKIADLDQVSNSRPREP